MGKVFKAVKSIVGLGSKPKAKAPAPVKTSQVVDTAAADKEAARKKRASLFETAGGVKGQELNPDQVQRRQTLLGN